jgi:Family of unknown function (DUF5681)
VTDEPSGADQEVGYGKPPRSTRFRKGRSGNPRGRPRGRHKLPPYEAVLGQMVTIREDGVERRVTAAEAFLLYMAKRGLEAGGAAARDMITAFEEAAANRPDSDGSDIRRINIVFVSPGSVNTALEPLRMAQKLDRYRETARMALEPWLVEAALSRLGDRRLSLDEQETMVDATRTPWKVAWPEWWQIRPSPHASSKSRG